MSVKKRIEELNSRFADKLSEKGVSADASDTTTELINKLDEIEVGIKVDPYVGDYVAEPTITDQKFPTKNLLMLDDFVVKKIPSELLAKEEQEKTLTITKNGTHEVKPDENKVLSSVSVEVDVKDETLAEIETTIDESGVLDSTEGSVSEKVEQLIDKAEDENLWHQYTAEKTTIIGAWNGVSVERLPRMNLTNVSSMSGVFSHMPNLKRVDFYIDTKNCTNFNQLFQNSASLEYVKGVNTSKGTNIIDMFYRCTALKTIEEPLDFSSQTAVGGVFGACTSLENIRIVAESIKKTFYFTQSSKLTAESIQSIIDGLATVETAQTLTINKAITLTDEQKATINSKGWTLAQ